MDTTEAQFRLFSSALAIRVRHDPKYFYTTFTTFTRPLLSWG